MSEEKTVDNVRQLQPPPALSVERQHMYDMLNQLDLLQRRETSDLESALTLVNRTNVDSVPGAQYAGITMIEADGSISTVAATHPYVTWLDLVQRDSGEGPCLSAAWYQHTIHIPDLATEDRWPRYREAALSRTPVRSVLAFRLFEESKRMSALNFYSQSAGAFDDESIELGLVYAAHTTVVWNALNREQQFRSAIANRDIIGQAKGILMERFKIDALAAFELLRRLSQQSNVRLVEIAERLVQLDYPSE
jgi:hypothetical protein